ncbi:MAG: hypothetical protein GY847_03825 [Proteobacteria bacterium]|nr:hypothetical protein [Pseudomonadota bacterium]
MGVIALVLSIMGICSCWLPWFGWLGVGMGAMACGLGVPSITHWFEQPGNTGWGVAGISLGGTTVSVGLAFQIKYAAGSLDTLFFQLPIPAAYYVLGPALTLIVIGILVARLKSRPVGVFIAYLAIAAFFLPGGWALLTADRAMTRPELTGSSSSQSL